LDTSLIELMAKVPADQRVGLLRPKPVLRRAFWPLLPKSIWNRKKHGFSAPVGPWFRSGLREVFEDEVLADDARTAAMLDRCRCLPEPVTLGYMVDLTLPRGQLGRRPRAGETRRRAAGEADGGRRYGLRRARDHVGARGDRRHSLADPDDERPPVVAHLQQDRREGSGYLGVDAVGTRLVAPPRAFPGTNAPSTCVCAMNTLGRPAARWLAVSFAPWARPTGRQSGGTNPIACTGGRPSR